MATFQSSSTIEIEQVDTNLIAIQEEYLENAPGVKWNDMGLMNHINTWRVNPNRILL